MLTGRKFHMLRDSFDEGLSISEIARQTGYDRKTIRKYIVTIQPYPLNHEEFRLQSEFSQERTASLQRHLE